MARRPPSPAPRIDPIVLPDLVDAEADDLGAHTSVEGLRVSGVNLDGRDFTETSFHECELVDVSAHEAVFRAGRFVDTTLERVTAPVLTAPRSHFRDVRVGRSRIGSAELYQSGWQSVEFVGCKLGYLNLRGSELRDVRFTDCAIDELDLAGARVTRMSFPGSQLGTLDVTGSTLVDADLRGLEPTRIVSLEGLAGAILDHDQVARLAPHFAERLGIRIEG